MGLQTVFIASFSSLSYLFPNGKAASFVNGVYKTDKPEEIAHLKREIELGHPHISVPALEAERVVDSVQADPMVALKEKMRQEVLAELAASNANRDMGNSSQGPFKIQTTEDIRHMTLNPDSGSALKDRLAALRGSSTTLSNSPPVPQTPSQLLSETGEPMKSSVPEVITPRSNPPVIVSLDTSNPSVLESDSDIGKYPQNKE